MRRTPTQYHQGGRGGSFAPLAQDEHDHELENEHETEIEAGEERISGKHRLSTRERFQHQVQQVIRQSSLTHEDQQYEPVQLHNAYAAPLASPRLVPDEFHEIDIAELAGTYVEYYGPRAPSSLSKESDAPTESTYVDEKDKFFCRVYETPMIGIEEKRDPLPTNKPPRDFIDYRPFVLKNLFSLLLLLLLATLLGLTIYSTQVLPATDQQLSSAQNSASNQSDAVFGLRLRGVSVRLFGRVEQNENSTQPGLGKEQPGKAQPQESSSSTAAASPPVKSTSVEAIPTPEETPAPTEVTEPSPPPNQHFPSSTTTPPPSPVYSPLPGDGKTPQPPLTSPEPQPAPTSGDGGGDVQSPTAPPDTTKTDTAEPVPTEEPAGPGPTKEPVKVCTVTNVVTITKTTTLPEVTVHARDLPGLGGNGGFGGLAGGLPGLGDIFGRGPGSRKKNIAISVTRFLPRQVADCASTTTVITTTETTVAMLKTVTVGTPETTPDVGLPVVTNPPTPPVPSSAPIPAPVETEPSPGNGDSKGGHGSKGPGPPNTPVDNTTPIADPGQQLPSPNPTLGDGNPKGSDAPTPGNPVPQPTPPQPTPEDGKPKNTDFPTVPIQTPAPGPDDPEDPVHIPSPQPTPGDGKPKTPDPPHPPDHTPAPTPDRPDPETKPGHQAPPTPSPGDDEPKGPDQPKPPVQTPRPTPDPDSPVQTPPPRPDPPVQTPTPNSGPSVQPPTSDSDHPVQTPTPNPGNPDQIPTPTPNPNTAPANNVSPLPPPKSSATTPVDQAPNPGNTPPLQQQPTPPPAAEAILSTIPPPLATSDTDGVPPPVLGVVPTLLPATNTPASPPQQQKPEEEPDDEPLRPLNTPPPPPNKPGDEPLRPLNTPPPQLKMPEGTPLPPHTITVVVATEVDQHSTMTSTSTETTTDAVGAVFTEEHITTLDVVQKVASQATMVYTDWTETGDFMTLLYTTLTDAAGNPTATLRSLVNMAPFLTTYTDAEGRPTSTGTAWHRNQWRVRTTTNARGDLTTETFASMTTTSTMMNEWGRATGTTTMVVTETLAVTTLYDPNGVPTRTKTIWEPVTMMTTMMTTMIVTPTPTSNSSRNSINTASLSALNISSKDYFVGLVLPPLLAVAVSIPVRILDQTAKLYQPFHALTSKYGAETVDSLCLQSNSLLGFVTGIRSLMRHHVLLSVTGLLLLINAVLIPLSAEAFRISVQGPDCSPRTAASSHCNATVRAFPALVSIAIALLSAMMLLVVVTAVTLRKFKSGVWTNPWNMEVMGQLAANEEFRSLIKKFRPKNNSGVITNKDAIKTLGQRRFGLNGWYDNYGWNYGIVIKNDAGSLPKNHKRRVGLSNKNTLGNRRKAMPFCVLGLWGRLLALLLLVALLVTSLVYISTGANSRFEHFMDGDSFGVRFLFCGIGVVISLYWATFFNAVAFLSPYRLYRKHYDLASALTPPTNAYSGLWEVCRRRRPDVYLGLVAFTAILSDVMPILLANVPSKALQASTAHFVCTWFAAAVLSLELVVITGSFLIDWPSMSMNPSKVAGAMYFAQDPGTFLGGYAERSSTPGGRSSQV